MGFYEDALTEWGVHADTALAAEQALVGEWTVRALFAEQAQAEAEAEAAVLQSELDVVKGDLRKARARVQRLLAIIAELQGQGPPPPTMPVGSSLWTGTGETQADAFARRTREWGAEPELSRVFFSGMPNGWPTFGTSETVLSFKPPSVRGMARGDYDARLTAWLDSLPRDGRPLRVAVYHEREDNIEGGQFTFADARGMDTKLHQLITEANARNGTNITFGLILMGWTLDARSGRKFNNYLPTDGWMYDWFGWDAYPGDHATQDLPSLAWTTDSFTRCRDAGAALGVDEWYICETGTRNLGGLPADEYDQRQAAWITGACRIARDLGCAGFMYFDSTVGGDFRILGPAAKAAIGAEIRS